ncbi:hypothetical protein NDU88_002564 [Pleurodeles waltl]|uniref:Uncharacterized protein n=1 Tax=Pleurodeles waltl TaxID=8319 RepID=A0AAV7RAC4_PLEWA|nr:hypothetical protein NDU88_002564 [Pleurodeles waltl]
MTAETPVSDLPGASQAPKMDASMERILQEIRAVSRRWEGMDTKISDLAAESNSIRTDIAGFEDKVTGMECPLSLMEDKLNSPSNRDQELQYLQDKLTDLEDRRRRDNICFFGCPERAEGTNVKAFLIHILFTISVLAFSLPLELQRVHHLGYMRTDQDDRLRRIIACFLHHHQVQQLLVAAHSHGPYDFEGRELRMASDFSWDTNDKQRAFLPLRPQFHQMDIKFGLFEPACMWITKAGKAKDFYDPQALRQFLDDLLQQPMDSSSNAALTTLCSQGASAHPQSLVDKWGSGGPQTQKWCRPADSTPRSHEDRETALQTVAVLTREHGRDKSRFILKPLPIGE